MNDRLRALLDTSRLNGFEQMTAAFSWQLGPSSPQYYFNISSTFQSTRCVSSTYVREDVGTK